MSEDSNGGSVNRTAGAAAGGSGDKTDLREMAAQIVSAYASRNSVSADELINMLQRVHESLQKLHGGAQNDVATGPKPAVPIDQSVTDDFIICLEDGKKLKMLKRYLRTHYRMTPEDYRRKWGLPANYPMSAPNYSAKRSQMARRIGLGRRPKD